MVSTKVVKTTNDIHACQQSVRLPSQGSGAAGQDVKPLAEGGIEPFNESGIDPAVTLGALDQLSNLLGTTLNNAAGDFELAWGTAFDHLDNSQFRPGPPLAATLLTVTRQFAAKGPLKSFDIAGQTIHGDQQGSTQSHSPHLSHQRLDQHLIAAGTNHPPQPQPGRNHHRHRDPNGPTLYFRFDFIGLDLLQVQLTISHFMLVDLLTMVARSFPPFLHRSFIKTKGGHDSLHRTAMGQQSDDQHHAHWVCFQSVEDRAFLDTEGRFTNFTVTALLGLTMHTDISFISLSSCRTAYIGAKYLFEVHRALLFVVMTKKFAPEPLFFQIYPFITLLCTPTGVNFTINY
jgi:hypothetical protein